MSVSRSARRCCSVRGSLEPRLRAAAVNSAVDGGGVGGGHLPGDVADAVGPLDHGDPPVGQRPPVPFRERQRLQPNDQPQQPAAELFRGAGLRRVDHLIVHHRQGVRLGDPAGGPVDHPHLLGVQIPGQERLPTPSADRYRSRRVRASRHRTCHGCSRSTGDNSSATNSPGRRRPRTRLRCPPARQHGRRRCAHRHTRTPAAANCACAAAATRRATATASRAALTAAAGSAVLAGTGSSMTSGCHSLLTVNRTLGRTSGGQVENRLRFGSR